MLYRSTRNILSGVQSHIAIKTGMAPDGGLFVPEYIPKISETDILAMVNMSYKEIARVILSLYLDDYPEIDLTSFINEAYSPPRFPIYNPAPIHCLNDVVNILELWHGPTCAFKDIALQLLPRLLVKAVEMSGEHNETAILVATSGDTGKAAMEGFKDVKGTKVIVFYPEEGVSEIQKAQMITQQGDNVFAVGVHGNFDDAQSGVKAIFGDSEINRRLGRDGIKLSSANSINWGRLVPQIVYYFHAYASCMKLGKVNPGAKINFVVPTGNFGNILAAYYAFKMGLPVNKLICASNINNVLTDFISVGTYNSIRPFHKTISPSMDILISSNLERLLFDISGEDESYVTHLMERLKLTGAYTVSSNLRDNISEYFWGGYSTESSTLETISDIYREYGYLIDTHTAVGIDVYDKYVISTGDMTPTVITSTASPFKFCRSVAEAVIPNGIDAVIDEFKLIDLLSEKTGIAIPDGLKALEEKQAKHLITCQQNEMASVVENLLK